MAFPSGRLIAVAIVLADIWRAWPNSGVVWLEVIGGGTALALIFFPAEIDALTFGDSGRGYTIDSHTPGCLLSGFGWVLLLGLSALLFLGRFAPPAST
jgi:hypothetical protein